MKKNLIRVAVYALAVLMIGMVFTGASSSKLKVLTIGTPYGISTLQPYMPGSDGDRYVLSNIYESLIENTKGSQFLPGLAVSWSSPDDLTYEFKLRNNAYWQTGNKLFNNKKVQVTAKDVKDVFNFILDKNNKATKRANFADLLDRIDVVDNFTIRFVTKTPSAMFLKYISDIQIFPVQAIAAGFDLSKFPVGSGPYKFSEYRADDRIVLVCNDDYYIKPNLDKVIFKIIPDKAVAAIALQNKEVDIIPQVLSTDLEAVAKNKDLKLIPNNTGWLRYVGFNTSYPLLQDVKVRQALSMAIDFDSITDAIFSNSLGVKLAVTAYGPIPPEFLGSEQDVWKKYRGYNPQKAQELLEQAGWSKDSNGIYAKDGKELAITIKSPANDTNRIKMGDMAATYLKKIGVACTAQPTEWATLSADVTAGNTQMFITGGGSGIDGMKILFHSTSTIHKTFINDPTLEDLINKAFVTVNDKGREKLLKEASERAVLDYVHAGGYFEYIQIGMNKHVTDFEEDPTFWYGLTCSTRNVGISD